MRGCISLLVFGGTCTHGLVQLQLAGSGEGIFDSVKLVGALPLCTSLPLLPLVSQQGVMLAQLVSQVAQPGFCHCLHALAACLQISCCRGCLSSWLLLCSVHKPNLFAC